MPTPSAQRSSAARSAEVLAVAVHLSKLGDHLALIERRAEAVVVRRAVERLRAALPKRCRLP